MTSGSPLLFPGSRALAGWWQALGPWHPQGLWVGHLLLHHVEALVRRVEPCPLDRFQRLILQAVAGAADRTFRGIEQQLHLGPQFLHRALHGLAREQLVEVNPRGEWRPTPSGQEVLEGGDCLCREVRRDVFHFLEGAAVAENPPLTPAFVNLAHRHCIACPVGAEWHFDPRLLEECIRQGPEWKRRRGFPAGIEQVLSLQATGEPATSGSANHHQGPAPEPWQLVVVDRAEQLLVAMVRAPGDGPEEVVLGFEAEPEGSMLSTAQPALSLSDGLDLLPELADEPGTEEWRTAWRNWCCQEGITETEGESSSLVRCSDHLELNAPRWLAERLRARREDVWLLAGSGRIRRAMPVVIREPE